jgi:hypothetical protein
VPDGEGGMRMCAIFQVASRCRGAPCMSGVAVTNSVLKVGASRQRQEMPLGIIYNHVDLSNQ